ncbi:MAG: hypothetical protein ACT4QB_17745 [Gammaproteobacteria bacterium]
MEIFAKLFGKLLDERPPLRPYNSRRASIATGAPVTGSDIRARGAGSER